MNEYELLIEDINPCGGEQFAKRDILEVEADSPMAYVEAHRRFPVLEESVSPKGDTVIVTGDGKGNIVRYTFTE